MQTYMSLSSAFFLSFEAEPDEALEARETAGERPLEAERGAADGDLALLASDDEGLGGIVIQYAVVVGEMGGIVIQYAAVVRKMDGYSLPIGQTNLLWFFFVFGFDGSFLFRRRCNCWGTWCLSARDLQNRFYDLLLLFSNILPAGCVAESDDFTLVYVVH